MVLSGIDQHRWVLGLERMDRALSVLGHPERSYPHVLVAGTNGKGSTCVYLERILLNSGMFTGTTLSPHVSRFAERFRIGGVEADPHELETIRGEIEPMLVSIGLTYFEWCVVLAAVLFQRHGADAGIFEVGLGGRYDASNALDPTISVITEISLDHTDFLGASIADIAGEKARIARPGRPLLTTATGEALEVIRDHARRIGALFEAVSEPCTAPGVMEANAQAYNAALAVRAARMMGADPDEARIGHALRTAFLPGRIEKVGRRVIMDVAHNSSSVLVLVEHLRAKGFEGAGVVGILADKDYRGMVASLGRVCSHLFIASVGSPRSWGMREMQSVQDLGDMTICESITGAFGRALQADGAVVVTGSFHTVAEVRELLICRGWPA